MKKNCHYIDFLVCYSSVVGDRVTMARDTGFEPTALTTFLVHFIRIRNVYDIVLSGLGHFHRGVGSSRKVSCHYNLYTGELSPRERSGQ